MPSLHVWGPEFKSQHINKEPAIVTWPHIPDRDIYIGIYIWGRQADRSLALTGQEVQPNWWAPGQRAVPEEWRAKVENSKGTYVHVPTHIQICMCPYKCTRYYALLTKRRMIKVASPEYNPQMFRSGLVKFFIGIMLFLAVWACSFGINISKLKRLI